MSEQARRGEARGAQWEWEMNLTMPIWLYALALGGSAGASLTLLAAAAFPIEVERQPRLRRIVLAGGLASIALFGLLVAVGFAP